VKSGVEYSVNIFLAALCGVTVLVCYKENSSSLFLLFAIGGACSTCGDWRNTYRVVVRKFDVERPLGRPRRRWIDNIKVNFKELGCEGVNWFHVAHDMAKC
jgi:hypothetical protein